MLWNLILTIACYYSIKKWISYIVWKKHITNFFSNDTNFDFRSVWAAHNCLYKCLIFMKTLKFWCMVLIKLNVNFQLQVAHDLIHLQALFSQHIFWEHQKHCLVKIQDRKMHLKSILTWNYKYRNTSIFFWCYSDENQGVLYRNN